MKIDKLEFNARFDRAVEGCLSFGRSLVNDELPQQVRFDLEGNGFDILEDGRAKLFGGRLVDRKKLRNLRAADLRRILWVDGEIPDWINLTLQSQDQQHCYIEVLCSRRLCGDETRLMHQAEGNPPFHILGPQGASREQKIELPHRKAG